ncbi:MAG: putative flavoprotein involved in transport [Solirubrobacterales bacterium]|nr:putative flavoprotein involved in transport [Solirubrobacterales bacterium]
MATPTDVDVVVVGAGFAGLYATHRFRNLLGLRVQSFEAGSGPGGTWYWNRYPGARCDFESVHYSYSFDEELQREWKWSERFSAQPEILRYLEHVADRFDLRRSYAFDTRVVSLEWDDAAACWRVGTDTGRTLSARFVISAAGNVSVPKENEFPGQETFAGEVYRTSAWPHEGVDLTGKRVAVIGTGATGIQLIPVIAEQAAQVTVFQRTPNFACPLGNRPNDPEEYEREIADYPALREASRNNFLGAPYPPAEPSALAASPEERRQVYDRFYEGGGFRMVISTYGDLLFSKEANDTVSEYIREQIRGRVQDPATAEMLCPTDHPYATKRAPFETNYYEAFNRDNVTLVDARTAPIEAITPTGVRTASEAYEADVIVLATGFDAFTGSLMNMGITGRDGRSLREHWAAGPRTYLGIGVHGFPNLFTITGPQSAVALYNNPLAIEDHVEFAADAVKVLLDRGASTFEPSAESEAQWKELVDGIANMTLLPQANSWYMGANIPGKPRTVLFFAGGAPLYRAICAEVEATGYGGFAVDGQAAPVPNTVTLDPGVAIVLGAMLTQGARPLEELSVEEAREALEGFTMLQLPPRDAVKVSTTTFPAGDGSEREARIYIPAATDERPLPVLVFFHAGGWIGGSLDMAHEPCTALAEDLGAIVVAPSYRLAPEDPFPAATDDTFAALRWVADTIAEHGGDPSRIAVAGESAGGNLAAVAAQRARDEHGPDLVAQVLIYPPIDPDADTPSRRQYAAGPILSTAAVENMWTAYLGDPAHRSSPLAAPSKAGSLAGLPPALVLTVEADLNRDEAEDYGAALTAAGVPTQVVRIDGLVHASLNMSAYVPKSRELYEAIGTFLTPVFGTVPPEPGGVGRVAVGTDAG